MRTKMIPTEVTRGTHQLKRGEGE